MRLLFITQKLHGQDSFAVLWIRAFLREGFALTVLCLEGGKEGQESKGGTGGEGGVGGYEFPVLTLGKERGYSRVRSILRFQRLLISTPCDRVFIHMAPVYYALGAWWWILRRVPCYLWYTHYRMQLGVRLFGWFGARFFCATPQSLPQYEGHPKKIVVGHGIDLAFWPQRRTCAMHSHRLLVVHRLSRSKRLELVFRALALLEPRFTLDIYGIEAEPDYVRELHTLVQELRLSSRVTFHGSVPMAELPEIYVRHRLILNMASETIDKTMLEAMTCGCYPVTTASNARAIGIPAAPSDGTPEAIAAFIRSYAERSPMDGDALYGVVRARHSLERLVRQMGEYITSGT